MPQEMSCVLPSVIDCWRVAGAPLLMSRGDDKAIWFLIMIGIAVSIVSTVLGGARCSTPGKILPGTLLSVAALSLIGAGILFLAKSWLSTVFCLVLGPCGAIIGGLGLFVARRKSMGSLDLILNPPFPAVVGGPAMAVGGFWLLRSLGFFIDPDWDEALLFVVVMLGILGLILGLVLGIPVCRYVSKRRS